MKRMIILLFASLVIQSCKTEDSAPEMASVTVVNAAIDVAAVRVYASEKPISWRSIPTTDAVNFGNFKHLGVFVGAKFVIVVNSTDTTKVLYNARADLRDSGLSSLFLCGSSSAYEGIYLADENLPNYTEEVVGVRFINLSPNSPALSVNLAATPTVNEATNLAYKQNSVFKTYPASNVTAGIAFQVRNASTGDLLASYTLPATAVSPYTTATVAQARFKNVTLVIKGLVGTTTGANAFGVFPVSHY